MASSRPISFYEADGRLYLRYQPDNESEWVLPKLEENGEISLRNTFSLNRDRLQSKTLDDDGSHVDGTFDFLIGKVRDQYRSIDPEVLGVKFRIFIHKEVQLDFRCFVGERNISFFGRVNKLINEDELYIGGDKELAIPKAVFQELLAKFPGSSELRSYARARISGVLADYFNGIEKYEDFYHKSINRKLGSEIKTTYPIYLVAEISKYRTLLKRLSDMLDDENQYSESQWQDEILEFILLLHPKYVAVFKEVHIKDVISGNNRRLDFMLIDALGCVDVVEIKKPFEKCLVSEKLYRNNHVPLKELSGTIMQLEKYIYNMMKGGIALERKLTLAYEKDLPRDMNIHITNPRGILILGRDSQLSIAQKNDFEIIRRKYKNVIDILTYDDLLLRLERVLDSLEKHQGTPIPITRKLMDQ